MRGFRHEARTSLRAPHHLTSFYGEVRQGKRLVDHGDSGVPDAAADRGVGPIAGGEQNRKPLTARYSPRRSPSRRRLRPGSRRRLPYETVPWIAQRTLQTAEPSADPRGGGGKRKREGRGVPLPLSNPRQRLDDLIKQPPCLVIIQFFKLDVSQGVA